jgi:hypothetical protein
MVEQQIVDLSPPGPADAGTVEAVRRWAPRLSESVNEIETANGLVY